jgi:formamidopyrimidine-DNA glycosylase
VEVGRERTVRRTSREAVIAGLTGTTITAVGRRGKYLLCSLDSGDAVLIHLRMSGQLRLGPTGAPRPLHTHIAMELDGGEELWFVDPRTFGEVVVFDPDRAAHEVPELGRLGPDPVVDGLSVGELRARLRGRSRPIKSLLLDQHAVAGLGNIYSDEVLFAAGLRYDRPSDTLSSQEVRRLYRAMQEVLQEAIRFRGTTLEDEAYLDLFGKPGEFQNELKVYGRAGLPCRRCRTPIQAVKISGRNAYFCPQCQS